jgi:hypothetical protein
MSSIERRLADIEKQFRGGVYCPACRDEPAWIQVREDVTGNAETLSGSVCSRCGSPDAVLIRLRVVDRARLLIEQR